VGRAATWRTVPAPTGPRAGREQVVVGFEEGARSCRRRDRRHTARRVRARATAVSHKWTRRCH
jgi:hypothetical protein